MSTGTTTRTGGPGIPQGVFAVPFGRAARGGGERDGVPHKGRHITTKDVDEGALSHLLAPRVHVKPDELTGVTIDCTGARPVLIEHTKTGHRPKHIITDEPLYIDIKMPDGREVCLEVRLVALAPAVMPHGPDEYLSASLTEFIDYGGECAGAGQSRIQDPEE